MAELTAAQIASWDRILSASQRDDVDAITELVKSGVPVTHSNRVGQTAFHIASLWGNHRALSALISFIPPEQLQGPAASNPLNVHNRISGATPLHTVTNSHKAIAGLRACLKILLSNGADPTATDSYGAKPADYTDDAEMRDLLGCESLVIIDFCKELLRRAEAEDGSAICMDKEEEDGACGELTRLLVEGGKEALSEKDSEGNTAVHMILAAKGVKPALRVKAVRAVLEASKALFPDGRMGSPWLSLSNNNRKTPLGILTASHCSASTASTPPANLSLAHDLLTLILSYTDLVNLDVTDQDMSEPDGFSPPTKRYTALHHAALSGDYAVISLLLFGTTSPGARPYVLPAGSLHSTHPCLAVVTANEDDGKTPFHLALELRPSPRTDIAELMLESLPATGGDTPDTFFVLSQSHKGLGPNGTLLMDFSKKGDCRTVEFLLQRYAACAGDGGDEIARIAAKGRQGMTALHLAARSFKPAVVKCIKEHCEARAGREGWERVREEKDDRGKTAAECAAAGNDEGKGDEVLSILAA